MRQDDAVRSANRLGDNSDKFARLMAAAAVLIAAVSCYFAYTSSPLYRGDQPELDYYYRQTNQGLQPDGRYASTVDIYVDNDTPNPAREVFVSVITFDDPAPQISASTQFTTHDAQPGQKLIKLDLVPAKGLAHVQVKARLKEFPDSVNSFPFKPWLEAPRVSQVYTEHGTASCRYDECTQNFASTGLSFVGVTRIDTPDSGKMTVQQAAQGGLLIDASRK